MSGKKTNGENPISYGTPEKPIFYGKELTYVVHHCQDDIEREKKIQSQLLSQMLALEDGSEWIKDKLAKGEDIKFIEIQAWLNTRHNGQN